MHCYHSHITGIPQFDKSLALRKQATESTDILSALDFEKKEDLYDQKCINNKFFKTTRGEGVTNIFYAESQFDKIPLNSFIRKNCYYLFIL